LRGCDDLREAEVERVLAVELRADPQPAESSDPTWIVARCDDGRVIIEVSDPVSRKTLRRTFHLGTARAEARARLIGIAASELVLASWAELALRPRLRVEPEGPAPDAASAAAAVRRAREAPEQRERQPRDATLGSVSSPSELEAAGEREPRWREPDEQRLRVLALASTRAFVDHDGALFGGGVRIGDEPFVATSWALDALFESGSIESGRSLHVETWTLGGMVYVYGRTRWITARAGAGVRAGLATTALSADDPNRSRLITPWGWPMLALSATLRLGKDAVLELSGESSYVALPVVAGGIEAVNGIWVSGQLGFGIKP
jgi:hypothetical protein